MKTVFIDNMTEDVWSFVSAIADEGTRQAEVMENVALTERHYLGALAQFPRDLTFISPMPIDPRFATYVHDLLQVEPPKVLSPQTHQGRLSKEIFSEQKLLDELPHAFDLHSYCASRELMELVSKLVSQGYQIETHELPLSPQSFQDTVNVYGTKCGLRQALARVEHPEIVRMAPGVVCNTFEEAVAEASRTALSQGGVVVKTNKGHAGMGVVIFDPQWIRRHRDSLEADIRSSLSANNGYWDKFPISVEAFVLADETIGGGLPNIEGVVTDTGAQQLFYGGMRVVNGVFAGMELGIGVKLPPDIFRIWEWLGSHYHSLGYRGYFDIDFVAGKDGAMYICESNTRRTG
jgi:hypothetical protein